MPPAVFETHLPQQFRRLRRRASAVRVARRSRRAVRRGPSRFPARSASARAGSSGTRTPCARCGPGRGHPRPSPPAPPGQPHAAARRAVQPGAQAQERRLAAARRADDGAGRPRRQRKADPLEHGQLAVAAAVGLGELLDFEDGGTVPCRDGSVRRRNVAAPAPAARAFFAGRRFLRRFYEPAPMTDGAMPIDPVHRRACPRAVLSRPGVCL